jgi:hypothetical protein
VKASMASSCGNLSLPPCVAGIAGNHVVVAVARRCHHFHIQ